MQPRRLGLSALALLCTAATIAPATAGDVRSSKVTIDDYRANSTHAIFEGAVESGHKPCEKQRVVKVIGRQPGVGKRVFGRDVTAATGRYKVREPIPFSEAFAYARVKPSRADDGVRCGGDRSREISTAG